MKTEKWNKLLLSVFKKSLFLSTEIIPREQIKEGCNLLANLPNWSTKVLVEKVDDDGLITNQFALPTNEKATIEEFQLGEYTFQNGWSKMYFQLDSHVRPFLVVSVITDWMDTHYYNTFTIDPEALDAGADISALLDKEKSDAFPHIKAAYKDGGIAIDFEGEVKTFPLNEKSEYVTPSRNTSTSTITIYDEDHSISDEVSLKIEIIP